MTKNSSATWAIVILVVLASALFMITPPLSLSADSAGTASDASHLLGLDADNVNWKEKDNSYWKQQLPAKQYQVCRDGGTERAYSGLYNTFKDSGTFYCSSCGNELFSSETKFDSRTGWPSFYQAMNPDSVQLKPDNSFGMKRTEVACARCGAHLGHIFNDGPEPTGKRYCINSVCLIHEKHLRLNRQD